MGTTDGPHPESQMVSNQTRLQKIVLSWDFYRLLSLAKRLSSGLRMVKQKKRKKGSDETEVDGPFPLKKVPERFKNLAEYLSVFESLLLEECRAQIIRGEEDGGGMHCHMVALMTWEKANEFYFLRLAVQEDVSEGFTENDLLLVSKEKPLGGTGLPKAYAFASIETREGSGTLRIRMHLDEDNGEQGGIVIKVSPGSLRLRAALQGPTSAWWIMKLCNLSTIMREYGALRAVGTLPFIDVILSVKDSSKDQGDSTGHDSSTAPSKLGHWNIPPSLKKYLIETHNPSQMQAIQAGLTRKPLVLIQGPPGTGKTQTILGLLSVILHSTPSALPSKTGAADIAGRPELPHEEEISNWLAASPWLGAGTNPRDLVMPVDGDDGYFPSQDNDFRPQTVGAKRKTHAHVLVCAPSNSALDEIVARLMRTGLRDESGMAYTPTIVRVGLNTHHSVQAVSMDALVEQRLSSTQKSAVTAGPRSSAGMERDRVRIQILDEAAIVCSTLSFSGAGVFKRMNRGFDVVVIDEAAQAVEPSTMVPLMHDCRQAFLVGDPLQLPATVLSTRAVEYGYGTSLFKRFQTCGYPVQMLKIQYRMHPQIREFPSKEFYANSLEDGAEIVEQTTRPWHEHLCFGPFVFFDVPGKETQPSGSGSWINEEEADFVLVLYQCLVARYPSLREAPHIAVISPYKQQVKTIRDKFRETLGLEAARRIDINTVDGFQGREEDIAIFSCVRANPKHGIGFVSDFRRMNVGLTRARASLLVVGCSAALKKDKHWNNLITSAQQRRRLLKVTKPYAGLFHDQNLATMKALEEEAAAKQLPLESDSQRPIDKLDEYVDMGQNEIQDEEGEYSDEQALNHGDFGEDEDDI